MKTFKTSINHLTGKEQNALHTIKKQLVSSLKPLLILYLGSEATTVLRRRHMPKTQQATDFSFSCTLLVIVAAPSPFIEDPAKVLELEEQVAAHGKTELIVRTLSQLNNHIVYGKDFIPGLSHRAIILHQDKVMDQCMPAFPGNKKNTVAPQEDSTSQPEHIQAIPEKSEEEDIFIDERPGYRFYPQVFAGISEPDPFQAIDDFFDFAYLTRALEMLDEWLENLNTNADSTINEITNQLAFYEYLNLLMDAAWLIHESPENKRPDVSARPEVGEQELLIELQYHSDDGLTFWHKFPRSIPIEIYHEPYGLLDSFFDVHTLTEWKSELHMLLHLSLSSDAILDLREGLNIYKTWNLLKQLIETCYLIRLRILMSDDEEIITNLEYKAHEHTETST